MIALQRKLHGKLPKRKKKAKPPDKLLKAISLSSIAWPTAAITRQFPGNCCIDRKIEIAIIYKEKIQIQDLK